MPSPKDMPGSIAVDTPPSADEPKAPEVQETNGQGDSQGDDYNLDSEYDDAAAEIARLRTLLKRTRKAEDKLKVLTPKAELWDQNADKVKAWDEYQKANQSENERLTAEAAQLRKELERERTNALRNQIAAELKVPARFVTGKTENEMREAAEEYNDSREREVEERLRALKINPAAPASAVTSDGKPNQVKQLTRAELATMSHKEVLAADKNGQLEELKGRST